VAVLPAVLVLAAALAAASVPPAAGPPGTPVPDGEREQAIAAIRERQKEIVTVRASVVQRKVHPLLKSEAVTEGRILLGKPGFLRWETEGPGRTVVVSDGSTLTVYRPEEKEAERRNVGDSIASRAAVEFLSAGLGASLSGVERRFRTDLFRSDRQLIVQLTPRSGWLSRAVAVIRIYYEGAEPIPRRFVVLGPKGDRTETILSGVVINPEVSADAFTLRLGADVRILDADRPGRNLADGP
jgi:outer membrane lipoprotein-sorting protein